MSEINRILEQLKCAYEGPAWHGPALLELLNEVDAEQAAARPLPARHTIWELVLHVITWQDAVEHWLRQQPFKPTPEQNFPAIAEASPEGWAETLNRLRTSYETICATVRTMTDADLDKKVYGRQFTNYFVLHGVIQHNLYHAGQIAVLRKPNA
jgi:uncharacterized damage-inducible protein DinB